VYSVVDFFLRTDNRVMERILIALNQHLDFGYSAAMAWLYFLVVIVIIGVTMGLVSRKVYYYE